MDGMRIRLLQKRVQKGRKEHRREGVCGSESPTTASRVDDNLIYNFYLPFCFQMRGIQENKREVSILEQ